jgi:hypothetical protein
VTAHDAVVAFVIGNILHFRPLLEETEETRMHFKGERSQTAWLLLGGGGFVIGEQVALHPSHLHHK